MSLNDINSLSHMKWNCKYPTVFVPKYCRQGIYGKIKAEIGQILRRLCVCEHKGIGIIEANACLDLCYCFLIPSHRIVIISFASELPVAILALKFACLSNFIRLLFSLRYPVICDTLYFGGVLTCM